jgi:hypothetical protein
MTDRGRHGRVRLANGTLEREQVRELHVPLGLLLRHHRIRTLVHLLEGVPQLIMSIFELPWTPI